MSDFVPLHVISGYSFLQSGLTIDSICENVSKKKYFGVGLTDRGALYGAMEFVNQCKVKNINYILGMEVKINDDNLSLFCYNQEGYLNLINLNFLIQKDEISLENLKQFNQGLIGVIETNHGQFKEKFTNEDKDFATYLLDFYKIYKDDFYLGIEVTNKQEVAFANKIRNFANKYNYKCVSFPRILYAKKDDAIVLEIVNAIANDETLTNKKAQGQEYFMDFEDYKKIYSTSEINNTVAILKRNEVDFNKKRGELLHFDVDDSPLTLKNKCYSKINELSLNNDEHLSRLEYELDIIIKMGYADYFLLVQDYVNYCKANNIIIGPGRGSAAGSLVSYLLGITEIDPLKYGLQFERFLNPHRKTMPDIDIDFMDIRRDEVVNYMREKYGQNRVANIVTFQTILAKQSLRDIGRVYGIPNTHIDLLSKRLSNKNNSLRESYKLIPEFKQLVDSDEYFLQIVSLASKIEGLPRQTGLHAAGIVLNNADLSKAIPVSVDFNGNYISQYEMKYLEEQGFLKMDFLGLRNLTTIDYCLNLINNYHHLNLKISDIPYEEKQACQLIASGQTMGVFQLESSGMKRAIKTLKPTCFIDIVALLALFRPGPMDSIIDYANRKHGKSKIDYISKDLEPILSETYGIIVYQEQVNQIATIMAGYSLSQADMFRRAISKKNKEEILANEKSFIEGSIKNGYNQALAKKVFDNIKRFSNYAFNKSHSVVYAVTACRMAWLKLHYPLEFYAAILETSSSTNDSKFNEYVSEMKQRKIQILPPNINESMTNFTSKENGLLFPLSAIKGINDLMVHNIIKERENGLFTDLFNFVARMFAYKINETQLTRLIDSGCLDCFSSSRACLRASIRSSLQYAELNYQEDGQLSMGIMEMLKPSLSFDYDDPLENLYKEYDAIGIMLSDNPLHYKHDLLMANNVMSIAEEKTITTFKVAGIIKDKKTITTKKGDTMAFIKIFDETGEMEIIIFSKLYQECLMLLEKNNIIIAEVRSEYKDGAHNYIANNVTLLEGE